MSLSQIGEFSFIIATLGMSMNVTSSFLYPIVVAVSAITTFTTPFMVKSAVPFSEFLERKLPKKWVKKIARYSTNAQAIRSVSTWQIVIRAYLVQIILNTIIITAIILLSANFVLPLVEESKFGNAIAALITLVAISPFLWALSLRRVAVEQVDALYKERKYRGPILMMIFFRIGLAIFYIGFLLNIFFSPVIAFFALVASIVIYFFFPKKLHAMYHRIENRFLKNLNNRDLKKVDRRHANLTPWDGHMSTFEIAPESNLAGKTLRELQVREDLGINIAFIKRGELTIQIPNKLERLFPGDEICVIGTDAQVEQFESYLKSNEIKDPVKSDNNLVLKQIELSNNEFIGVSVGQSKLRERTNGLLVGIERNGQRILNPESNIVLQKDDILWIVGNNKLMNALFPE